MVSIIFDYPDACMEEAKADGFEMRTVLVKMDSGLQATKKNIALLEAECRKLRPYRFIVGDYWGACPE